MPCTWTRSLHNAPHKIMFSDRIQFRADTVSTIKPFMHTAHHLGRTCKFIMVACTMHTKLLSLMPQISLADRHKHNYCLLANCLRDFSHPDQPAVANNIFHIDHITVQRQYAQQRYFKIGKSKVHLQSWGNTKWHVWWGTKWHHSPQHGTACLHMGSFSDQTSSIQGTKSVITLTI
jgi:hypothetical protein